MLGSFLFLQQWQDAMKAAGKGFAGLATRSAGASVEALHDSLLDAASEAPAAV